MAPGAHLLGTSLFSLLITGWVNSDKDNLFPLSCMSSYTNSIKRKGFYFQKVSSQIHLDQCSYMSPKSSKNMWVNKC